MSAEDSSGIVAEKRCSKCGQVKPLDDFHRNRGGAHGRNSRCRSCRHRPRPGTVAKQRDIEAGTRRCKTCGTEKPIGEFYFNAKTGVILGRCGTCIREKQRLYRQGRPEIYAKASRKYQKANPEVVRAIARRRKGRKKGAPGDFTNAEWDALKARHGYRCLLCGMCEPLVRLTPDHIVPISKGGSNFIDNIQPLCAPCNSSKGTKSFDLRSLGR